MSGINPEPVKLTLKKPDGTSYKTEKTLMTAFEVGGRCDIIIRDKTAGEKAGFYEEDISKKEGEEYLKAILWTEKCSNGIHIMYYTPV